MQWQAIIDEYRDISTNLTHNINCPVNSFYRNFIQKVHNLYGRKWISSEWKHRVVNETPKQCNKFDCGIFSLKAS